MNEQISTGAGRDFENFPFDFNGYLARRLVVSREGATAELGRWLVRCAAEASERKAYQRERPRRSGIYAAVVALDNSPDLAAGAA